MDLGSRLCDDPMSSFLGELDALQWALKATKSWMGLIPTEVLMDNYGVVDH